ncbi:MFS general substrate transporter [Penicillium cataractarum]|uniref:MFS general substrate transporter n=1 Tax=Penicillium cataractarum TaxID=2100454 RepID=A0A9W9V9I8_9EURO|nr:MFS general substrate transporter [Penicillium cataractarum]KAJ5371380.1 MFS general substrate transporter [Penicillium cataractarum]
MEISQETKEGETGVSQLEHTEQDVPPVLNEDEPQTPYQLGWRTILAVLTLSMANVCAALSNTTNTTIKFQVATVAHSPSDAALASWIANGNFLLSLALGPIFGSVSDRLGKKWFLVGGASLGVIGSMVSGSAHKITDIIGGNILTGIANAGCIVSISCIQEIMPNKLRPWAMGVSQAMASAFVILGTFVAAAFVQHNIGGAGGWRWAYYFNGIIYGFTAVAIGLTYFPPRPLLGRHRALKEIMTTVDFVGILLMAGSFTSLIIGLTWGGTTYPWNSGRIIATLTMGCVGLVLFGLYEAFVVKEGILDRRLFSESMNFPILLFVCTIDGILLLGVNVALSQEIFDLFTQDAVSIAVMLTPYLALSTFGCIPAGWIMASTKSYKTLLVAALLWCSLFTGLMGLITAERKSWAYAFSALFGAGTAVTTTIPVTALALSIPSYLIGTAATVSMSCRALGGIVGITIFTAIYNNKYASYVGPEIANNSEAPVQKVESAMAWKYMWITLACLIAANGVAACFLKSVKSMMTGHVESALEHNKIREKQLE